MIRRRDVRLPLRLRDARRRLALLAAALLMAATPSSAQHATTGAVAGKVLATDGRPLAGATVTIAGDQGTAVLVSDADGRFLAPYVAPGPCTVRAELDGYRPAERRELEVGLGERLAVELTLAPGVFSDTVDVVGATPVLDLSSPAVGLSLSTETLARVPVGRSLADTLYLAPGVSSGGGVGRSNPSVSGASGLENQYVVDGVNITNTRYGALGTYSSEYGSLGNGVNFDFVDEVRVATGGASAELQDSTGGVISVVTRSGSNQVHGSVFGYATPAGLEGERRSPELVNGAADTVSESVRELGFTLGGPLRRDRLFYFVAAGQRDLTTTLRAPEGFPLRRLGEVDRDRNVRSYAAKLTALPSTDHRLELTAFGDPSHADRGPQAASALLAETTGGFSELDYGGHNQGLSYQGVLGTSWLVEASAAHAASRFSEQVAVDEWQVTDETVTPVATSGGKGRYESSNDGDSTQLHASSTHFLGDHELHWGVAAERTAADPVRAETGPPIVLADGQRTASGAEVDILADPAYGSIYRVTRAELTGRRSSTGRYRSAFVQDRWAVGGNLTLEAGVRWERQQLAGSKASFTFGDEWAPRLGLVWDPLGNGRSKLSASWGETYARIPNALAVTLLGVSGRVRRADYFDPDLSQPIPDGVEAGGTTTHLVLSASEPAQIDPTARVTSMQQYTLGWEWVAARDLTLGVRYLHRDLTRVLEDVTTASLWLTFVGTDSVEYMVTNPRDGYPATVDGIGRFVDPVHRYDAVELTADKRFGDRWSLLASYRWSRLEGNYEGFYRSETDQSSASITGIFDFPPDDPTYAGIGGPDYGFRGDIRYLARTGVLPNDRPHQLKGFASYRFDFGLGVGAALQAVSGRPLTPMAVNPVYGRAGEIPEAPRGAGITTEDGFRRRTDFEWSLDLHLDYELPVGGGNLVLVVDVFNLLDGSAVTEYDQNTERDFGVLNPDYGRRTAYQSPRQVRLGLRFEL